MLENNPSLAAASGLSPSHESQAIARPESNVIWSSSEGQVVNFGLYLLVALTFWLVLPVFYAVWRYVRTARHTYTLTDQRLLESTGIWVKEWETLELYRVKDISVRSTLLQTLFGRGRIVLVTSDVSNPTMVINAISQPTEVASALRDAVERCRVSKGVRAFDY